VRLRSGDPLTQEWFVLALGPDVAVTLCGLDAGARLPPEGEVAPADDSDRLFEVVWSFSPGVARDAFGVVRDAIAQAAPDRLPEVDRALAGADQLEPVSAELVARGADHLVAGLMERVERSRRLERRTAARASLAKTEFLSRMSHELRTPLNVILGFTQLMQLDGRSEEDREGLEHVERAGRHLLQLIDEVLDIARIEEGRLQLTLEDVPVGAVVEEALSLIRPLAGRRGIVVDARGVAASPLVVHADRRRLRQVLLNLLANAVKYNAEHGRIDVRVAGPHGGLVRIAVADTGPGIPAADQERIFVPFERATGDEEIEGTGLGLPITQRLAAAMAGRVELDSRVGRGSTFAVLLPGSDPTPAPEPASDERVVVYVEDNAANVRLIERALAGTGLLVRSAPTAARGLELARRLDPALVLLDLNLPDQHGSTVLAALQQDAATRDVPVVVVSSDALPATADRLLAAGARAFLTKPLDLRELRAVVDEVL